MTVVVDASVAVQWVLQADDSTQSYNLLRDDRLIAPDLVLVEIANAVWKAVRFANFPISIAMEAIAETENGFDEFVSSRDLKERALAIAIELQHSAYDCFYLALAEQRGCQLVTADARLLRRCAETPFAGIVRSL
jgi:predicted nucleic acid-binding protein